MTDEINSGEKPLTDREILMELVKTNARGAELNVAQAKKLKSEERWNMLKTYTLILFVSFVAFVYTFSISGFVGSNLKDHVGVVELNGAISADAPASAANVVASLEAAMKNRNSEGVILKINSPGGSPAQSEIIHREMLRLRQQYKKPIFAVAEDYMASGSYLIAVAANEIYVQPSTVAGSIGVVWESWGLEEATKKLGIEYRVLTAGDHKRRITMFDEMKPDDVAKMEKILSDLHQEFKGYVVAQRGLKLNGNSEDLFTGDIWLGREAVELGLADKIGTVSTAIQDHFTTDYARYYRPVGLKALMSDLGLSVQEAFQNALLTLSLGRPL